jgi:two-component system, OmpR family, sensor histidine kinase BaeS
VNALSLFSKLSLRIKLVLSYLAVALGAILILTFAIAIVVQNYFTTTQLETLRRQAQYRAQQIAFLYPRNKWSLRVAPSDPVILVIADTTGKQILCSQPAFLNGGNCNDPTLEKSLTQALQENKEVDGTLQVNTGGKTISSLSVSVPLLYNGQVIGAMFLSAPQVAQDFSQQANLAILIAGLVVAVLVVLFSFLIARGLTRPLESLTVAAEQMKQGKYAQRVEPPRMQDELRRLALTFNAMADTIEADVTELRHQEQVRRDMLANIAHDLATPLTAIQGLAEALADEMISDAETRQETALRIGREVQRLRRLVKDLQQMSLLESGHAPLDLALLDMYTLTEETLNVIQPECEQMSISLHNDIAPALPPVLADSDRITEVLLNLLDNARHHIPTGGSIHIGAYTKEDNLYIWVSDTGTGITPKDLPHIFERFYRADRSHTETADGSGLCLSIVKAIIIAHKGTIWAESEVGHGTCITFTLPLARSS